MTRILNAYSSKEIFNDHCGFGGPTVIVSDKQNFYDVSIDGEHTTLVFSQICINYGKLRYTPEAYQSLALALSKLANYRLDLRVFMY